MGRVEPHGLTPVAPMRARGAEPRRSHVLLRRGLAGTASQQHPLRLPPRVDARGFRRRRVKHGIVTGIALGLLLLLGAPRAVLAEEGSLCPICKYAGRKGGSYSSKAGYTLLRGASNACLDWTELIRQPANEAKSGGHVLTGVAKGVGNGVMRTLSGMGEVLTFWTPKVKDNYLEMAHDCPLCMKRRQAEASAAHPQKTTGAP